MEVNETIIRESKRGPVELEVQRLAEAGIANVIQVNCLMPSHGPGFFVLYPAGQEEKAIAAALSLYEREDLPYGANITDQVPGCLCAGTVPLPTVQFGTPEVRHAD